MGHLNLPKVPWNLFLTSPRWALETVARWLKTGTGSSRPPSGRGVGKKFPKGPHRTGDQATLAVALGGSHDGGDEEEQGANHIVQQFLETDRKWLLGEGPQVSGEEWEGRMGKSLPLHLLTPLGQHSWVRPIHKPKQESFS